MKNRKISAAFVSLMLCLPLAAIANEQPESLATDARMKVVNFDPNNVVTIHGSQLVQTSLQFSADESIVGVEGGDAAAWLIAINKERPNILFVKPAVDASDTNLAVITDKNFYHFHLIAKPHGNASNADITYNVRFVYPLVERAALLKDLQIRRTERNNVVTDAPLDPLKVNWNYSYGSGCAHEFVPIHAFDDGNFTYFEFPHHTEIPAIFTVNRAGKESLVNWHMRGRYVVVQKIAHQFSMRSGKAVSCVFNDGYQA